MDIKQIVDAIVAEGDLNPSEYPEAARVRHVNDAYFALVEEANQIGSTEPISGSETLSETFNVTQAMQLNEFARSIKDVPVLRVDFKPNGATKWERMDEDVNRPSNGWCGCEMSFYADEKRFFVENGRLGTVRVTYSRGNVTPFTVADLSLPNPPKPEWLPSTFHPLLWMVPVMNMTAYYKPDRHASVKAMHDRLHVLFRNHYSRNANRLKMKVGTKSAGRCCGRNNNR